MPRILRTTRRLPKETLQLERFLSLDAQGMPSYASPVDFQANVLEYDAAGTLRGGAEFVVMRDGSQVKVPLTLYVQGDEANVPAEEDRITRGSAYFIAAERKPVSGLRYTAAQPDHYRVRCRVE